jgi:hypothetical protein
VTDGVLAPPIRAWSFDRSAAVGGVVFVVLDLIVAVLGGEPPTPDAPSAELTRYYADKAGAIEAGLWLFGLAVIGLIWWSAALWRWLMGTDDTDGTDSGAAAASMLGLSLAGALSLASATVFATLALHVDTVGDELTTFHAIGALLSTASGIGVAAHLLATNLLGSARARLPRWLVATGTASAAAWILQAVAGATSSTGDASSAIGLAAFVSWCAWILGMSQLLWRSEAGWRP